MIYLLFLLAAAAASYQVLSLVASIRHLRAPEPPPLAVFPSLSILKPVHGLDPHFYEAIRSHAEQDYPAFEILFGVSDPADPAVGDIERLAKEFPAVPIRLILSKTQAANGKVGVLADLAAAARYPVLLINDSDIAVPAGYLRRVVTPLGNPKTGVVTCLYRGRAEGWPGRLEAIGIATDFAPSVLVAPLVGVSEFALGSTMVVRRRDLDRMGGFAALAGYLADDYQLGRHIRELGLGIVMSKAPVVTCLPDHTWNEVRRHQLRWARTIRVSRGDGYLGMPLMHAGLWAALLAAAGYWRLGAGLAAVRLLSGVFSACFVLGDRRILLDFPLILLRDVWGFCIWFAGLFGKTVEWRGRRLLLNREGKILGA